MWNKLEVGDPPSCSNFPPSFQVTMTSFADLFVSEGVMLFNDVEFPAVVDSPL